MDELLSLPPLFTPVPLAGDSVPLSAARAAVALPKQDTVGQLFYAQRPDRLEAALVLAPERPLEEALPVLYPLHLGLCSALGALLPSQYAVQFGWPDRIFLNGALCGAIAMDVPDLNSEEASKQDAPWMILAITLALMGRPDDPDPGKERERTTFYDEGAGDIPPRDILEAFARHFLSWLTKWEDQGLEAIWPAWEGRALGYDEDVDFLSSQEKLTGRLAGLTETGDLRVKTATEVVSLPLDSVLKKQGWSLAGGA